MLDFLNHLVVGICIWGLLGLIPLVLGFHPEKEEKLIRSIIRGPFNFKLFWQNEKSEQKGG